MAANEASELKAWALEQKCVCCDEKSKTISLAVIDDEVYSVHMCGKYTCAIKRNDKNFMSSHKANFRTVITDELRKKALEQNELLKETNIPSL